EGYVDLFPTRGVDSETRRDLLSRAASAPAHHGHPPAPGAARSKQALPIGRAFEQRKDVIPERAASVNLDGGASDGIAIAIDVKRAIGGADDDSNRSARAALRVPVVVMLRQHSQDLGSETLGPAHQAGIGR